MPSTGITKLQLDEAAIAKLAEMPEVVQETESVAEGVQATAQRLVRKRTGRLQRSIRVEPDGEGGFLVGSDEDHALPNEFGTASMPAQPYLRPALGGGA